MSFSERVRATELPLDEVVVIGSGLLEQYGIRRANDIDLVVSQALFEKLKANENYSLEMVHDEERLVNPPIEIWRSWGSDGKPNFTQLYDEGQTIEGVRYVATKTLLEQKKLRNSAKDKADIVWLEGQNAT